MRHSSLSISTVRTSALVLAVAGTAAAAAACASKAPSTVEAVATQRAPLSPETERYIAGVALGEIGADVAGSSRRCAGCHALTIPQLREWGTSMRQTNVCMTKARGAAVTACLRKDSADPSSPYSAAKIGLFAAGAHTSYFANIFKNTLPATKWEAEYKKFQEQAGMPRGDRTPMSAEGFGRVRQWVIGIKDRPTDPEPPMMPRLEELLSEAKPTAGCTFAVADDLKAHVSDMIANGWAARNAENALPMFACPIGAASPLDCFQQQSDDGNDIFPLAEAQTFSAGWAYQDPTDPLDHTIRILRKLTRGTYYWSRSSADGRYFASGSYYENGGRIMDLRAELLGLHRDIHVVGDYDPAFFPDNSAFSFHGVPVYGPTGRQDLLGVCKQSVLNDPITEDVTFREAGCTRTGGIGQYESIGSGLDGGDSFIMSGTFMNDDRGRAAETGRDPFSYFGVRAGLTTTPVINTGTGFSFGKTLINDTSFEGDSVLSPSTNLVVTRVAGAVGSAGYSIRLVNAKRAPAGDAGLGSYTSIELPQVGRFCDLKGGKVGISYDERAMALHHYVDRDDFAELGYASAADPAFKQLLAKGASNVYIVDLTTGDKTRITTMLPGQYALYPHFRSDGWMYFLVRDVRDPKVPAEYAVASDALIRMPLPAALPNAPSQRRANASNSSPER